MFAILTTHMNSKIILVAILSPIFGLDTTNQPISYFSSMKTKAAQGITSAKQTFTTYKTGITISASMLFAASAVHLYHVNKKPGKASPHQKDDIQTILEQSPIHVREINELMSQSPARNRSPDVSQEKYNDLTSYCQTLEQKTNTLLSDNQKLCDAITNNNNYLQDIQQRSQQLEEARKPLIDLISMLEIITDPQDFVKSRQATAGAIPILRQKQTVLSEIAAQEHMSKYTDLLPNISSKNYTEMQLTLMMYLSSAIGTCTSILTEGTTESVDARKMHETHNNFGSHESTNPFLQEICDPVGSILNTMPSFIITFTHLNNDLQKLQLRTASLEKALSETHTLYRESKILNKTIPVTHPLLNKTPTTNTPATPRTTTTPRPSNPTTPRNPS